MEINVRNVVQGYELKADTEEKERSWDRRGVLACLITLHVSHIHDACPRLDQKDTSHLERHTNLAIESSEDELNVCKVRIKPVKSLPALEGVSMKIELKHRHPGMESRQWWTPLKLM